MKRSGCFFFTFVFAPPFSLVIVLRFFSRKPLQSLKRKDKSGVAEGKGSAGTGKIVNLMAGDSNRVGNSVSSLYMLYGGEFVREVFIECVDTDFLGSTGFTSSPRDHHLLRVLIQVRQPSLRPI